MTDPTVTPGEPAGTPEPDAAASRNAREYVVLRRDTTVADRDWWEELGTVEAGTDRQAIAALTPEDAEGTYVAVPARSWRPRTRKLENVQKTRWS